MTPSRDRAEDRQRQIIHAAHMMIERYGQRAPVEAAQRVLELDQLDDRECLEMWRKVLEEVTHQVDLHRP